MIHNVYLQEYLQQLFNWIHEIKISYSLLPKDSSKRAEEQSQESWEQEFDQLVQKIEAVRLLPFDSPEVHEEIAKIKEKSERIYQQLTSLWHRTEENQGFNGGIGENKNKNEDTRNENKRNENKRNSERPILMKQSSRRVPIGEHKLPPLPYPYDALEPYIDQEIMRLHHNKHHQSYVDGLNKAEKKMAEARRTGNYDLLIHWEREAAFHGAGHYLHTIFWNVMSPTGGGQPTGNIAKQINEDFGSFEKFKEHFTQAANQVEGVGWAILVWSPRSHRLEILQAEKHQLLSQWDVIPLLVLDVWEHAYYLQYKNERKKYVDNWWNVVNWAHVNDRFNQAKELKWEPY